MFKIPFKGNRNRIHVNKTKYKKYIKYALTALGTFVVVFSIFNFIIIPKEREKAITKYMENQKNQMVKVLVAKNAVKKGSVMGQKISKDNPYGDLDFRYESRMNIPDGAITRDDYENRIMNRIARIDIEKNTIITRSMIAEKEKYITDDMRRMQYNHLIIPTDLKASTEGQSEYVDIRIKFEDGSDYIVCAKKEIKNRQNSAVWINMYEDEIQLLNIATVDASMKKGRYLYTASYVSPENQERAEVTYIADESISQMVKENPAIVEEAKEKLNERRQVLDQKKESDFEYTQPIEDPQENVQEDITIEQQY